MQMKQQLLFRICDVGMKCLLYANLAELVGDAVQLFGKYRHNFSAFFRPSVAEVSKA